VGLHNFFSVQCIQLLDIWGCVEGVESSGLQTCSDLLLERALHMRFQARKQNTIN
jgi:hypothetical protein